VSNKNNGPISGVTGAIARGFNEFSNIPLIGEYAKGISWISDRISKAATVFGFSKPTAGDSVPKVLIVNAPSHTTVDGDSDSRALSFLNQPGVVPLKGMSGTDYDEMDFSYIKSKYAWFQTVSWSLSNMVGSDITSFDVTPLTGNYPITASGYVNNNYTPVCFLAKHFKYWRGSLKFKFKIVKTEYHSGRLQFAFYPTDFSSFTFDAAYVNRVIVDIREHSEIELIIPYIAMSPWLIVNNQKVGVLRVSVVDPLVAPSSVSPSVNILIEMAGGEDFETAGPIDFLESPTALVPQGLDGPRTVENIHSSVIGSAVVNKDAHLMSSLTIGDKVSSVRALVKRFTPLLKTSGNSSVSMNTYGIAVVPDLILFNNGSSSTIGDFSFNSDLLSVWASCYTFMSGGIRIRDVIDYGLTDGDQASIHTCVQASLVSDDSSANSIIVDTTNAGAITNHRVIQDCFNNNAVTVEIPQYTKTFSRSMVDIIHFQDGSLSASTTLSAGSNTRYRLIINTPTGINLTPRTSNTLHRVYRAGADDLNLSGFVSIPPMRTVDFTESMNYY
jgi:hypothetical protein